MALGPLTPASVFRRYNVDGVPESGEHKPDKGEVVQVLERIEAGSGQSITRNTVAALNGVTPPNDNYMGVVLTGTGAGYYSRSGGAWVFGRPFPDTMAGVTLSGNGTAQAGTPNPGVNPASVLVYFAEVSTTNTGPLKLTIGGVQREVVNAAGNPLSLGEWTGGVMFRINPEGKFQLINEAGAAHAAATSASFADQRANEADEHADRSEDAADRATEYAALAGSATGRLDFKTVTGLIADEILGYVGSGAEITVGVGGIINAQGFRYEVAASGASDHHLTTAGGVKLYVLKKNGCWYAEAFGVVTGNWITDAPEEIVDCTEQMQAALNVLRRLDTLILPSGTIYCSDLYVPYASERAIFNIRGEGWFTGLTTIQFLAGTTGGFNLGKDAYSFYNISFRGVGDVEDTFMFTSTRDDNRVDMDWQFFNCHFVNARHIGHLLGRGLTIDNCLIGYNFGDLFILDYPNPDDVIQEPAGYIGTVEGGFRGFTIRNSRLHATFDHIFRVTGNNAQNARGFTITGNQCDGYLRVIKGHANDVVFTGNNWYVGWNSADACLFDLLSGRGITISGNTISNSTQLRQAGDNPLVRCVGSLRGLTIVGNTFVRRDVPVLDADLSGQSGAIVADVTIANNTYLDCFVTAPCLVRIKNPSGTGVQNVKVDESIFGVPTNWLAVDGDTTWRNSSIKVLMNTASAKQHNIDNPYSRDNERRWGAYTGTGAQFDVFVGYKPKVIRIYKSDGSLAAVKMANTITAQPASLVYTDYGFTVTGNSSVNTNGTVYLWEVE
jgi:hypothetical protein